ncbi:DUF2397 family protein [Streptosporangium vulgare]|uniref:DUF2397 family protein n=1 Tax=Streptosporangium vulgare TaxID=46190 RepID=UPI0031D26467
MELDDAKDFPAEARARLDLYRYATADKHAHEYVALMRLFTNTLLTDLSATEAVALLEEAGITLSADDVEDRCRRLESWGNLVRSVRDARVATVSEWLRSRSPISDLETRRQGTPAGRGAALRDRRSTGGGP